MLCFILSFSLQVLYRSLRITRTPRATQTAFDCFFFYENLSAVITDAIESLTAAFEGLNIKKSRVHEFMKDKCNISLKVATLHPGPRNDEKSFEKKLKRAQTWTQTWTSQKAVYLLTSPVLI